MSTRPDDSILRAVRDTLNGNPEAYTRIVTAYMDKLHRTATGLCTHPDAAEDLVQETLIDGFLHLSELREPDKIEAWLTRILKHKALRQVIRARKTALMEELPETPDHSTPAALYSDRETMNRWRTRLENLSPALRETAILYFWEERPMEEIALRMNIPLGTVKSRINAARAKLRKEYSMSDTTKSTLPDSFAEAIEKKVEELANYHKLYGTHNGFDAVFRGIKELIPNLSSKEDVKKYACRSAAIAASTNEAYVEEALETFRKYGDAERASNLYLDVAWKRGSEQEKADYIASTAIPALSSYPDGEAKEAALGYHYFWLASHTLKTDTPDFDKVDELYRTALAYYSRVPCGDSMYANTVAARKFLPYFKKRPRMHTASITGEGWLIRDGNIYYYNQPGFGTGGGALADFENPVFYFSGYPGDRYFFPRTIPIEAGRSEKMTGKNGLHCGTRRVVSTTDTVETPAGVFRDCVHIQKEESDGETFSAWYKENVGLVKSVCDDDPRMTKVLLSYEIRGGEGLLPLAVGNTWRYENPAKPDTMTEVNEYVIEQMGTKADVGEMAYLSCMCYIAVEDDWQEHTEDTSLHLAMVSQLCDGKRYSEAADMLRGIITANRDRESVDIALTVLSYLEEKAGYDQRNWRFCPSSANVTAVTRQNNHGRVRYNESRLLSCETGVWGTRFEENRIFGVKPFRYLQDLTGTLWDDRWIPGYTAELPHPWEDCPVYLTVTDGGRIETPAGVFASTVCLTVETGELDAPEGGHYFYNNVDHGHKQFWFAPGVGVVRFACQWGRHLDSDAYLTAYHVIAAGGEVMPFHIGNRWQYDESKLTEEGYIARREYSVLAGMGGHYLLGDHQMFTFKGTVEEYDAFKERLKRA